VFIHSHLIRIRLGNNIRANISHTLTYKPPGLYICPVRLIRRRRWLRWGHLILILYTDGLVSSNRPLPSLGDPLQMCLSGVLGRGRGLSDLLCSWGDTSLFPPG